MKRRFFMKASCTNVEIEFRDWRGTPIEVGSIIVYPTSAGSGSATLTEAEVIEITPDKDDWNLNQAQNIDASMFKDGFDQKKYDKMINLLERNYKLKVKRINVPGGWSQWDHKDKKITLRRASEACVVIGHV